MSKLLMAMFGWRSFWSVFELVRWSLRPSDAEATCRDWTFWLGSIYYCSTICLALSMVSFLCSLVPGSGTPFTFAVVANFGGTCDCCGSAMMKVLPPFSPELVVGGAT